MRAFRDLPIRNKLILVILFTSTIALLLASMAAIGYELVRFRHTVARELPTEAEIIGPNSEVVVALAARDRKAAQEVLSALRVRREIISAQIFDGENKPFAEYARAGTVLPLPPVQPLTEGYRLENGQAVL